MQILNANNANDIQKLATLFNTYFINITNTLRLKKWPLKLQPLFDIISFYDSRAIYLKSKRLISLKNNFVSKIYQK